MALIEHPNVIQAYLGTEDDTSVGLFMEYAGQGWREGALLASTTGGTFGYATRDRCEQEQKACACHVCKRHGCMTHMSVHLEESMGALRGGGPRLELHELSHRRLTWQAFRHS